MKTAVIRLPAVDPARKKAKWWNEHRRSIIDHLFGDGWAIDLFATLCCVMSIISVAVVIWIIL